MTFVTRLAICIAMAVFLIASLSHYAEADADWVRYYKDKQGSEYYYDGYTLVAQKKGIFNVWTKGIVFDAQGAVRNEQPLVLFRIDCKRKSSVLLEIYWNGELYCGEQIEKSGKLPAIPEVALKALYEAVCK